MTQQTVSCPDCSSENHTKNGIRDDRQAYKCKDCGRNFLEIRIRIHTCRQCKIEFEPDYPLEHYCGDECRRQRRKI